MEHDPMKEAAREKQACLRLPPDSICIMCGEPDAQALMRRRVPRRVLEAHHITPRRFGEEQTIEVCRNCHVKLHAHAGDGDLCKLAPRTLLDVLVAILWWWGQLFCELGERAIELALQLRLLIGALDRACPEWRTLPEAGR